jgi:hypothetical protein
MMKYKENIEIRMVLSPLLNIISYLLVKHIIRECKTMTEGKKCFEKNPESNSVILPCGCVYQDKSWILTRINECEYHKRKRTTKRPYRPKAECVRP